MAIESYLSAEEMFKLSKKVQRWRVVQESLCTTSTLRGVVEGVVLNVSHSEYELGPIICNRYTICAKINETNLGKHQYVEEVVDKVHHEDPQEEIVKTTVKRVFREYNENRKRFKKEDVAHARGLIPKPELTSLLNLD